MTYLIPYLIIFSGVLLGFIIFTITFILSKKSGKYYMAPIVTFLASIALVAYSLFVVGGFEGMGYGMVALGMSIASIIGTLFLPKLVRRLKTNQINRKNKVTLIILSIILVTTIGLTMSSDQDYWVIENGTTSYTEEEGYRVTTIAEGKKQVTLQLGENYYGKEIELEDVKTTNGSTEITVKITDGNAMDETPYIEIGVDEIHEPLKVKTTQGAIFGSL